ncbi:MAG: hypothetical protein LBS91_05530 [Clostridiales Family XIII bacterium]|jgi:hypothetical protein|nr:hypothetical protein [Clostridiales Family XIII bacterium]
MMHDGQGKIKGLSLIALFVTVLLLFGCAPTPQYEVESYDALKGEFAGYPDIIFPDITKYEAIPDMRYVINYTGYARRPYSFECYGYPRSEGIDSALSSIVIYVCPTVKMLAGHDQQPPLYANTLYRGIEIRSGVYDRAESIADNTHFPKGYIYYVVVYAFDLNSYRYQIEGSLEYLPDEQQGLDIEAEAAKAQEELLVIVDSIMDQGGVL